MSTSIWTLVYFNPFIAVASPPVALGLLLGKIASGMVTSMETTIFDAVRKKYSSKAQPFALDEPMRAGRVNKSQIAALIGAWRLARLEGIEANWLMGSTGIVELLDIATRLDPSVTKLSSVDYRLIRALVLNGLNPSDGSFYDYMQGKPMSVDAKFWQVLSATGADIAAGPLEIIERAKEGGKAIYDAAKELANKAKNAVEDVIDLAPWYLKPQTLAIVALLWIAAPYIGILNSVTRGKR